ncbi:hypothetical protein AWH56_021345 [Anaerobacillus isosaccharinicus]|uniref:Uncharacterized protein n=1 Tax=Anaerobacillus isosaccharinicus TaxID=1532552 RepID=A0A1S2LEC9_9BACI|nr:hypothetical protein [Anaerobacillus isosaccharinicus]MBA5586546.1 hypothetical protein [Anaerobacillus isosaccharinicus]QOY35216.1 hypothetical protein AWH56_021345 [Anaerobacillus isosaccharinicus]
MNEELKELLRSVLKEELKPIRKQLDNFEQRFERIDQRLEIIEIDVRNLKDNLINGLGPYFEQITSHIDEVKEVTKTQQIMIETLSARSIKHESEIKEIKRLIKNSTFAE